MAHHTSKKTRERTTPHCIGRLTDADFYEVISSLLSSSPQ
jgi:hypothetical protein